MKPHVDFGLVYIPGSIWTYIVNYILSLSQEQISKQIAILYHWPKVIEVPILDGAR